MKQIKSRSFTNGTVYALKTDDGFLLETTDTFLPYYTKNCINDKTNKLKTEDLGSRLERWMIGVSVASGCKVGCKFCATGNMKRFKNLSSKDIVDQVKFIINQNNVNPKDSKEFKINYTRMGDTFLNLTNVRNAIEEITSMYPNTHHYISTIGIKNMDVSWIKGNITLQVSLHSLDESRRDELIPYKHKMTIEELGQIRTCSNLKTTVNMTLVDVKDFDINKLKKYFDPKHFFIKVSPINPNEISIANNMGNGIIKSNNLV
jgi:23S rRNA (adenine2503-C2)-methyltransferase